MFVNVNYDWVLTSKSSFFLFKQYVFLLRCLLKHFVVCYNIQPSFSFSGIFSWNFYHHVCVCVCDFLTNLSQLTKFNMNSYNKAPGTWNNDATTMNANSFEHESHLMTFFGHYSCKDTSKDSNATIYNWFWTILGLG